MFAETGRLQEQELRIDIRAPLLTIIDAGVPTFTVTATSPVLDTKLIQTDAGHIIMADDVADCAGHVAPHVGVIGTQAVLLSAAKDIRRRTVRILTSQMRILVDREPDGKIHTPNIDTSDGSFKSSFE